MREKPLPEPLYPCRACGDIQTVPADWLHWSDTKGGWYCDNCFDADEDEELGDMGLSLAYELKKRGLSR
jgi:hypothetical protein